ncbi:MAG: lipid A deacylase LpxR family protein [Alphaproteobacteria bacterium]|nr:MAG: lipid A deacylase LpxR family protein [Alphaproteobacteria bacterium]
MRRLRLCTILSYSVALCTACAPLAQAADTDSPVLSFQVENDMFATDTDRHYTNGLRLSYLTKARSCDPGATCLSGLLRRITNVIPAFREGDEHRIAYSLGQNMFTPTDIEREDLIPDDRPYAGWLYLGLGFVSKSVLEQSPDRDFTRLDRLELNLGVVGPLSGAEALQKAWHDLFGFRDPRGWDNQIKNEPGLVLNYERQWLFKRKKFFFNYLDLEFAPELGAALGNIFTFAAAGGRIRIGSNLPADYGPPRIRPSLPGSAFFVAGDRVSGYLFGAIEGRAMLRNIFLDGNSFRDSHSVDKKHLVGDIQVGAAIVIPRSRLLPPFRLSYTYIWRSKEFDGQDFGDRFGSISLSFHL